MPARHHLTGIVIRQQSLGEADLIVTMVSPDRGRVDAMARSARKSAKRFAGGLGLLTEVTALIEQGRGRLPTLVEASLRTQFLPDETQYSQLALASLAAELAAHASQHEHADPALFAWLHAALTLCGASPPSVSHNPIPVRVAQLALQVGFLQAAGVFPDLQVCVACGGTTAHGASWLDTDAGLVCLRCVAPRADSLTPGLVRTLALWSLAPPLPPLESLTPSLALRVVEVRVAALLRHVVPDALRSAQTLQDLTRFEV